MKQLTEEQGQALIKVLSLAENHQMWLDPAARRALFKEFVDEQYAAIQTVRQLLEDNGFVTLYGLTKQTQEAFERLKQS